MDFNKIILYFNTLKYLKTKQIYFRLYYFFRNKLFKKKYKKLLRKELIPLTWNEVILNSYDIYISDSNTFFILNVKHSFDNEIDWNYKEHGKLWLYNLCYFDFLNQRNITKEKGLQLILGFISEYSTLDEARHAYPISLRNINVIKFITKNCLVKNTHVNNFLFNQYLELIDKLEYELLGNHLLENAFSLLFGAYYFQDEYLYKKAKKILLNELEEQILLDGAHFERSPMYHQIILFRILECINLVKLNSWKKDDLLFFLIKKATKMLGWLEVVTFKDGNIPMVKDCVYNFSPSSKELFKYANKLSILWRKNILTDSGYRKIEKEKYDFFLDIDGVKPDYQVGHSHSDIFNFVFYNGNNPIIVETGTSSYGNDKIREIERGTLSHNTVVVNDKNQSQIWGVFRVAKRAQVKIIEDKKNNIEASHDGYKKDVGLHIRRFNFDEDIILIKDSFTKKNKAKTQAFFHFHPSVNIINIDNLKVEINNNIVFNFTSPNDVLIEKEEYDFANGFNKRIKSIKLIVTFKETLNTQIKI